LMEPTRLMNSGCVRTKIRNDHDQTDTTFRDLGLGGNRKEKGPPARALKFEWTLIGFAAADVAHLRTPTRYKSSQP
jgi:hypothetical protein